jgi:hypothetical protein
MMGLFDLIFGSGNDDETRRDRYGHDREEGKGPRVKDGPNGGLLRARNKDGAWRKKHKHD